MKTGPIVYGTLLAVSLLIAYQTWTRDDVAETKTGDVPVWRARADDVTAVSYDKENFTVRVERREQNGARYLWGTQTRTAAPVGEAGDGEAGGGEAGGEATTHTREFAVGEKGEELIESLADLHALVALGKLDDAAKAEYELENATDVLTVELGDGKKTLTVGGRVQGGIDRYALDPILQQGFVLAGSIVQPLELGESTLKITDPFGFKEDEVAAAVIEAGSTQKRLQRLSYDDNGQTKQGWALESAPGKNDQTMANFLSSLKSLELMKFDSMIAPTELERLLRVEYAGKGSRELGWLELYKKPATPAIPPVAVDSAAPQATAAMAPQPEYYLRSPRTRVPVQVSPAAAERIEQDIEQLFRS